MLMPIGTAILLPTTYATGLSPTPLKLPYARSKSFHIRGITGAGAGSVTVQIVGSNTPGTPGANDWASIGTAQTLTLSTTMAAAVVEDNTPFLWYSANVTAISGTNAQVRVDVAG